MLCFRSKVGNLTVEQALRLNKMEEEANAKSF